MPSLDRLIIESAQSGGFDGTFSGTQPVTASSAPAAGFAKNVYDYASVQPFYQAMGRVMEATHPVEEGFDPLSAENVKGFEEYAMTLREARSSAQLAAMKNRITTLRDTKARLEDEGGWLAELTAELANPFNYLPGGALRRGVGFATGFGRGAAGFAPALAVEETLRAKIDPTTTFEESTANLLTGTILGGLIGGGVGMIGGVGGIKRLAQGYERFAARLDGEPVPSAGSTDASAPGYVARPSETPTGVASAFGVEKATSRFTPFNRLVSRGIGAVEDFANSMAGEFDVLFNRNKVGVPTETSAFLRAGQWRGMAADVLKDLDRIYNEYLGGGAKPVEIANVNLPVTGQRIGQAFGMRPSDGLMTYREFMDAVFRAHTRNGIRASDPHVQRAAQTVRTFFDKARDAGVETGFLSNARFAVKAKARYEDRVARFTREVAALEAKADRTAQEEAKLVLVRRALDNARGKLARFAPERRGPATPPPPPPAPERRVMVAANDAGPSRAPDAAPVQRMGNTILQDFVPGDRRFDPSNDGRIMVDAWNERMEAEELPPIDAPAVEKLINDVLASPADDFPEVRALDAQMRSMLDALRLGNMLPGTVVNEIATVADMAVAAAEDSGTSLALLDAIYRRTGAYRAAVDALENGSSLKVQEYQTGKPFVADVFHGSKDVFDRFDPDRLGANTEAGSAKKAFFSSRDPSTANSRYYTGDDPNEVGWRAGLGRLEDKIDEGTATAQEAADHAEFVRLRRRFEESFWTVPFERADELGLEDYVRSYNLDDQVHTTPVELYGRTWQPGQTVRWIDGEALFVDVMDGRITISESLVDGLDGVIDGAREIGLRNASTDESPNVQMLRLRMDNPLVHDFKGERYREVTYSALIDIAKAEGRDGVVMLNTFDGGGKDVIYAAFSPDQFRARFDAERFDASRRAKDALQGRPVDLPAPANDLDGAASRADLRGAQDFNARSPLGAINDDVPDYGGPANDPYYLPRLWNSEAIREDEDGPKRLRAILTQWFTDNPLPGTSMDPAAVAGRVDTTIRNLIEQGDHGELQIGNALGGTMRLARDIDIPNELVVDFIETDVGHLIRGYAQRAGIGIEVARKFGTRDAEDAIDDMLLRVAEEATGTPDQILNLVEDIRADAIDLRDFTLGDQYSKNPQSWSRKTAQALTAWATLTQMGGAAISAVVEVAKPVLVHGVSRTLGFALNALSDPQKFGKASDELRALTGEGVEVTMGSVMRHYIDNGGPGAPALSKAGRALDKASRPFVNFANGPYYVANLLGPVTDALTTYGLVMSNHFMIEDILKVAKGKGSPKLLERLASYGLSEEDAARIAAQPFEKMTRLYLPNTGQWNDPELVAKFGAAVAGESRRLVVKTGPANKPNVTQGFLGRGDERREFALLRLPFQYMNFGFAAINKNLISALQGRDANVFAGTAALVGMGYLAAYLKSPGETWDKTPMEERVLRAVNMSGILGLYGDIPNIVENATRGQYGLRPTLGLPPAYGFGQFDEYSLPGQTVGPGGSKVIDLYRLFVDGDTTAKEQARIVRRMIPLNDLFYWKSIFKNAERGMTDAFM